MTLTLPRTYHPEPDRVGIGAPRFRATESVLVLPVRKAVGKGGRGGPFPGEGAPVRAWPLWASRSGPPEPGPEPPLAGE